MFRKDVMGKRGGGVLLYIKETIPAYEVQLHEEADCNEAIEQIHNAISEVSKGDCIIMGDFNNGNSEY